MDSGFLIGGLLSIIGGLGARFYPKGIDSYQCLPKKNRENIDLGGLSRLFFYAFVAQGIITIIASLCGYGWIFVPTIMITIFIVKIKEQKYFKNNE